jgi:hypothetical protein
LHGRHRRSQRTEIQAARRGRARRLDLAHACSSFRPCRRAIPKARAAPCCLALGWIPMATSG